MHAAQTAWNTAARDREGNIRMNEGRGKYVAGPEHNRWHIIGWLDAVRSSRTRAEFEAALALLAREAAERKESP